MTIHDSTPVLTAHMLQLNLVGSLSKHSTSHGIIYAHYPYCLSQFEKYDHLQDPTVDQKPSTLLPGSCLPKLMMSTSVILLVVGYLLEAFPGYRKKTQVSLTNERLIFNLKAASNLILRWSQSTILRPHLKDLGPQGPKLQSLTKVNDNDWQICIFRAFSHVPWRNSCPWTQLHLPSLSPTHLHCSTLVPAISPDLQHCFGWGRRGWGGGGHL